MQVQEHLVPLDVATKLALSLGVGLFAGFEREWSRKDIGVRAFALTALLGTLSSLISLEFSLVSMGAVALIIALVNGRALLVRQNLEITTSISLVVEFALGVLIGLGHLFTPVAGALLLTLILSLKTELSSFAWGLRPEEIRSAVLLGLIGFVIYPLLPDRFIEPWKLINPRESWVTIVVIAAIGFVNYVLLRLYGSRGLIYTAILGGLVNSTATIAEVASRLREPTPETNRMGTFFNFVTLMAMFARNLALLGIFARAAVPFAFLPIIAMGCCAALFVWFSRGATQGAAELRLSSPVSIRKLVSFGTLFLLIEIAAAIGRRYFGHSGVAVISFLGGLISSASTTAAAAVLSAHGEATAYTAGLATVITSIASACSNLPVLYRATRNASMARGIGVRTLALAVVGTAVLLIQSRWGGNWFTPQR